MLIATRDPGAACLSGIGVHDVVGLLQNGETVDSIVSRCFPSLTRAQVYECLAYYEDHRGEIDLLVARQMAQQLVGSPGCRSRCIPGAPCRQCC